VKRDTTRIGAAAVHLACADLLLSGYRAFIAAEGLHYDIVLDHEGHLVRVQVKSTQRAKARPSRPQSPPVYIFSTNRGHRPNRVGKPTRLKHYNSSQVDVIACVALDIRTVAYFPVREKWLSGINLYPPNSQLWPRNGINQRRRIDEFPIAAVLVSAPMQQAAE
jgi:PD-(D/E)XK nuclease superfamily protein